MFFSENKFYDRKESCLTKYYCIRGKLIVAEKFLTFSFKFLFIQLKSDSHLPEKLGHFLNWKCFKNDEKRFLFHLKNSFHFQDIQVFVTTYWSYRKNGLIRKSHVKRNSLDTGRKIDLDRFHRIFGICQQ